jgi:hypothetical protein
MTNVWRKLSGLVVLMALPVKVFAAGGGPSGAMVIVADTRGCTGWEAWWGNLYNESLLYFTLVTITIIPVTGLILSLFTSFVMARTGIDLKSRVLAEH